MTEHELLKKWQDQFSDFVAINHKFSVTFDDRGVWVPANSGRSAQLVVGNEWLSFLYAKTLGPVVELPKPEIMDDADGQGRGEYIMIETIRRRLDAAGIKYVIKGDV